MRVIPPSTCSLRRPRANLRKIRTAAPSPTTTCRSSQCQATCPRLAPLLTKRSSRRQEIRHTLQCWHKRRLEVRRRWWEWRAKSTSSRLSDSWTRSLTSRALWRPNMAWKKSTVSLPALRKDLTDTLCHRDEKIFCWLEVVPELRRLLTNIQSFIQGGYAYIDDSDFRHKVLQIPIDECNPIQTYGRVSRSDSVRISILTCVWPRVQVLYSLCLEVLDIPTNYTREMADEYMKLAELMTREHRM